MGHREVVQQIKFAFSRLGDSNGHHEFEAICLAFARQRISPNFLPATGPVSAYGDQGRDGETFWSAISHDSYKYRIVAIGDQSVVLACTLQSSGIAIKVKNDLEKITSGAPVDRVAYFVAAPMPVGLRHDLIATAAKDFDVHLDIFDLEALSIHLADPDLFWVATEYLHVAPVGASALPEGTALPEWYLEIRDRWLHATSPPATHGNLAELRLLARVATWRPEANSDLHLALDLLGMLADAPLAEEGVRWRAGYELCVATYRGTGDFQAIEGRIVGLVRDAIDEQMEAPFLGDANVLLSYGLGASLRSLSSGTLDNWIELRKQLLDHVAVRLESALTANQRVMLLSVESSLSFAVDYPDSGPELVAESREEDIASGDELDDEVYPVKLSLVDRDRGMRALGDLLAVLPNAPMYPVDSVASLFDLLTLSLLDHPEYERIRAGIETATATSAGALVSADRALRRALTLGNAGEYASALREASAASLAYWNGHDVGQSARSMIVEGDLLRMLGLHVAAKSRYLSAAWAAGAHTDDRVNAVAAEAIVGAAIQDYYLGRWATAIAELVVAFDQHARYLDDATDLEVQYLELATQSFANIVGVARSSPELWSWLVNEFQWLDDDEGSAASSDEISGIAAQINGAGLAPPFSDLRDRAHVAWIAFGTEWCFECSNDAITMLAADRLIATLQRVQFGLLGQDMEWLGVRIVVELRTDEDGDLPRVDQKLSERDHEILLCVALTPDTAAETLDAHARMVKLDGEAKAVALSLVRAATLNRHEDLEATLESLFGSGGSFSSPAVRQYDESARIIHPVWSGAPSNVLGSTLPVGDEVPATPTGLIQSAGLSPLFDVLEVRAHVRARYDAVMTMLWRTLPRIVADARVTAILKRRHKEGVLDWQILAAISNLVGSHRVESAGVDLDDVDSRAQAEAIMRSSESAEEPAFPLQLLDEESIARSLDLVSFVSLPSYGLSSGLEYPNLYAIRDLLCERFAYFKVDEPHPDIFGWEP